MTMKRNQLELASGAFGAHAFRQHRRRALAFMVQHRAVYETHARFITPNLAVRDDVWGRGVFAILSAHEPFGATCRGYTTIMSEGFDATCTASAPTVAQWLRAAGIGIAPTKAVYVRQFTMSIRSGGHAWLARGGESWDAYRVRLQRSIRGLGLTKASFLAALLYPLEADVCCVDTWMIRVFLGSPGSHVHMTRPTYLAVERRIRRWGRIAGMKSTFIAQWALWDHARGRTEDHGVLAMPGGHKNETV